MAEADDRTQIPIAAYCLMPNHRHLLLRPRRDGMFSEMMRWITVMQPGQNPVFGVTRTCHMALTLTRS
jgi:REP element-mobilizing transposase RayT